jgi:phosphoserine phosphatase
MPDAPGQHDAPPPEALLRVLDVARDLSRPADLYEMLAMVVEAGRQVLRADRGTVLLYDDEARELFSTVGDEQFRFSIDTGISGDAARKRQVEYVPDCYADPRFNPAIDRQTGYRTKVILALPLIGLDDELVGVMTMLNPVKGRFDEADIRIAEALAAQAAVAVQRALLLGERDEKRRLQHDMELARSIQQGVMPTELPGLDGYDLAAFSQPAEETGGDIYDVFPVRQQGWLGERPGLMLVVADATGHGLGPALSITQFRSMVRVAHRLASSLSQLVVHVNEQLVEDGRDCRFITAFIGVLDPERHEINYYAPGQGALLHFVAATGRCRWLEATTMPMGITSDPNPSAGAPIELAPGDLFVLLTDGFYEHANLGGEQFGRQRVEQVVRQRHGEPAQTVIDGVREAARTFSDQPQTDDQTALVIRRLPV